MRIGGMLFACSQLMQKIFIVAAAFLASLMPAGALGHQAEQHFPDSLATDSPTTIRGRILNKQGEGIGYVAVGIPGTEAGTISDSAGRFTLDLPSGSRDSITFFHVSYREKHLPAAGLAAAGDPVEILLEDNVLPEAVVVPGKKRRRRLVDRGLRIPAAVASMEPASKGTEVGTMLEIRRKFMLKKISFEVAENGMPGCLLSVNVYRVSGDELENMLSRPVYHKIPLSSKTQKCETAVDEGIMLEPGTYFIALALVDHDCQDGEEGAVYFPLYLKSSWIRNKVLRGFERSQVNIGLSADGLEYL